MEKARHTQRFLHLNFFISTSSSPSWSHDLKCLVLSFLSWSLLKLGREKVQFQRKKQGISLWLNVCVYLSLSMFTLVVKKCGILRTFPCLSWEQVSLNSSWIFFLLEFTQPSHLTQESSLIISLREVSCPSSSAKKFSFTFQFFTQTLAFEHQILPDFPCVVKGREKKRGKSHEMARNSIEFLASSSQLLWSLTFSIENTRLSLLPFVNHIQNDISWADFDLLSQLDSNLMPDCVLSWSQASIYGSCLFPFPFVSSAGFGFWSFHRGIRTREKYSVSREIWDRKTTRKQEFSCLRGNQILVTSYLSMLLPLDLTWESSQREKEKMNDSLDAIQLVNNSQECNPLSTYKSKDEMENEFW